MRVLFISVNKEKSFRPALPIGMAIVATATRRRNQQIYCLDLCFEEDDDKAISEVIDRFRPDAIGISLRNVDSQVYLEPFYYPPLLKKTVICCREKSPNSKMVLGGSGFSLIPEELMCYTKADFGIVGPGEISFPTLIERLANEEDFSDIPGLVYTQEDGRLVLNKPAYSLQLDTESVVDRSLYDGKYYLYNFNTVDSTMKTFESVQTKRGCMLKCIYCCNHRLEGDNIVLRNPQKVVDEFESIKDSNLASGIEFVDGVFNLPYDHALAVVKEMNKRGINFSWTCTINPSIVTKELVYYMKKTGCYSVEFGTDSCSNTILKHLNKNYSVADVIRSHNLFDHYGIRVLHCMIIGSPGETKETVIKTMEIMEELAPNNKKHNVFFNLGCRIYKGTRLYEIALDEDVIKKEDNMITPRFYIAPSIVNDDIILKTIEDWIVTHKNWYLWWGIPNFSLRERIEQVSKEYKDIEKLFNEKELGAEL